MKGSMFDKSLVLSILRQIDAALETIKARTDSVNSADDLTDTPNGIEKLDGVCMLFAAIGDALKQVDKITSGKMFSQYPEVDWKGAVGFRDIIVHHYFDIDADEVYWICKHNLPSLSATIKRMIEHLR